MLPCVWLLESRALKLILGTGEEGWLRPQGGGGIVAGGQSWEELREERFQQREQDRAWNPWHTGANGTQGSEGGQGRWQRWDQEDCESNKEKVRRNLGFSQRAMRSHWSFLTKNLSILITFLKVALVTGEARSRSRKVSLVTLAAFHETGWWWLRQGQ